MRTTVKTCFKCGAEKPLTEFYVHPAMGDGRLNKCKSCTRKDVRENYAANQDHYRAYEKQRAMAPHRVAARQAYLQTPSGQAAKRAASVRSRERNPIKYAANYAVTNAVRDGRLVKQPCEVCGSVAVDAHHDDYSRPLDVRWLCRAHHAAHHRALRAS